MSGLLDRPPKAAVRQLHKAALPDWSSPMLAVLTDERFSDPGWIFERKLDGERCLVIRRGDDVLLMSRNRKELNNQYPEVVDALTEQSTGDYVAEGEIVAFEGNRTSFARMQVRGPAAARRTGVPVFYYLFDLLYFRRARPDRPRTAAP